MKMAIKICERSVEDKEHEIKEIELKLQSNLASTKYNNFKEHVNKNQEITIQRLRRKKRYKYCQLNYGEQVPEKHYVSTRNSSVKSNQLNQEENKKNNKNNQENTKRTHFAALKSNPAVAKQNKRQKTYNTM